MCEKERTHIYIYMAEYFFLGMKPGGMVSSPLNRPIKPALNRGHKTGCIKPPLKPGIKPGRTPTPQNRQPLHKHPQTIKPPIKPPLKYPLNRPTSEHQPGPLNLGIKTGMDQVGIKPAIKPVNFRGALNRPLNRVLNRPIKPCPRKKICHIFN